MPTGNKYSQLALLVTESILHSYIIYLKKTRHRFSDGNPSQERVLFALKEVADLVELVRLTLKQKHHSGLVFADEEQQVSTETVPSLEDQVSQESLINSAALDIEHVAVPESVA